MGKKHKKTKKAVGHPTDDGELQAAPRRDSINAEVPDEPGVAINNLRVTGSDTD